MPLETHRTVFSLTACLSAGEYARILPAPAKSPTFLPPVALSPALAGIALTVYRGFGAMYIDMDGYTAIQPAGFEYP